MNKIIKYLEQANDILQSGDIRGQATLSTISPTDRNLIEIAKMIQIEEHKNLDIQFSKEHRKAWNKIALDEVERESQI